MKSFSELTQKERRDKFEDYNINKLKDESCEKLDFNKVVKNYDFRDLVKASQEYKDYFSSREFLELDKKIEDLYKEIKREQKAFLIVMKEIMQPDFNIKNYEEKEKEIEEINIERESVFARLKRSMLELGDNTNGLKHDR